MGRERSERGRSPRDRTTDASAPRSPTLGYFLGQIDVIAENIELTIMAVVGISILPVVIEVWKARKHGADDPVTEAIVSAVDDD